MLRCKNTVTGLIYRNYKCGIQNNKTEQKNEIKMEIKLRSLHAPHELLGTWNRAVKLGARKIKTGVLFLKPL